MLRKLLNEHKPEFIAASFDLPGRTFRDDLVDDYKANRAPMPSELAAADPDGARGVRRRSACRFSPRSATRPTM